MNELNENIIRILGSASVMKPLLPDRDYEFKVIGECYSKEKRSRQDGTYDNIFKVKLISGEVVNDKGESMMIKSKSRWSQKLRSAILQKGLDYEETMPIIISKLDEIV